MVFLSVSRMILMCFSSKTIKNVRFRVISTNRTYHYQSVEKRPSRESEGGRFSVFEAKKREKGKEVRGMAISPLSFCEFFEIYGSKFKPYPI